MVRYSLDPENPTKSCKPRGSRLIGKDSDAGKDSGQDEKGMTEDEMTGWHHQFDGRGFG